MGKEKIKIRYIIFVLITMGVIFFVYCIGKFVSYNI